MKKFYLLVVLALILIISGYFAVKAIGNDDKVEVVQWTNGHLMRPGLMPDMAVKFNAAGYKTLFGKLIEVKVYNHGSAEQSDDLIARINTGRPTEKQFPNPTVVTPSSADWLVRANYGTGTILVDLPASPTIAKAYVGIVTYQEMAEVLGWPNKDIGYADIIALRDNPAGWASIPNAKPEWGQRPLVAFTDPVTSTTGRSVLFGLYGIGAGKIPEQISSEDINNPDVVRYVRKFQTLIDHYMIGTIPLNTKVYQGQKYGQFFIMPEDNLIHLIEGTEKAFINGEEKTAKPLDKPMVMIYPKEGTMVRNNIAGIVRAKWVTKEQEEGARAWIDFLLQDDQQKAFMRNGFRPGSSLSLADPASKVTARYGLNAAPKAAILTPEKIDPAVADMIEKSWQDVKRPGIITFVVDVSGSMEGQKLKQVKSGIMRAMDNMAQNNKVGFLTFSNQVGNIVPVAPITENRGKIESVIKKMKAQSDTAMYDGIKAGVNLVDNAGGEPEAIRAVVVLTDGRANRGSHIDQIIKMISRNEVAIKEFTGLDEDSALDNLGRTINRQDIVGQNLAVQTKYPVQVFFIGIGNDADMEIGRILSQATGAEFQGVAEEDLAALLELFGKYF